MAAAALENLPKCNKRYAKDTLVPLSTANPEAKLNVHEQIFRVAVEKYTPRMVLDKETKKLATKCRMELRREHRDGFGFVHLSFKSTEQLTLQVRNPRTRLKRLSKPPSNMALGEFVDCCYAARKAYIESGGSALSLLKAIRKSSKDVEDDFSKLAQVVGRLGVTRSSANAVVKAMFKVAALQATSTS